KRIADWIISNLEILWWELTSRFHRSYYQNLIYAYRDYETQGLKTRGPFTLDLEKVFVPLRVAPESVDHIPSALVPPRDLGESRQIWDFLSAIATQPTFRRMVVIAPPGLGKTTLLEHLTLTYAKNDQRRYQRKAPTLIPVLIYLREVREAIASDQPPELPDLIQRQDLVYKLNPPPNWFLTKLKQGKCLVMLDGLDEVADATQRQKVSQWVDQQIKDYPGNTFILTSRPFGYRSAPLAEAGIILEVQPFTLKQMEQFIQNWYLQTEVMSRLGKEDATARSAARQQANDLISRIEYVPSLAAMAVNPLLLTMIATVHRYRGTLPGRRVELYAEICDVLLGPRQDAKGIADMLTATQKKSVLQVLALKAMQRKTREFKTVTACLLIREPLAAIASQEADPETFLQQIEDVSGLLTQREQGLYEFAHRSFQEYLAAVQIKELKQELVLARHIDDPWWDETIRLYAAQGDASNIIWAALQKINVVTLTLAYECLEESLSVQPDVRQFLEASLEKGLHSTEPEIFRLAADVKLSRRLRQLLRIDERLEIDTHYISYAEFRLFLEEARPDEMASPNYWAIPELFNGDMAQKPLVGVSATEAEAFCGWLTQRTSPLGDMFLEGEDLVFVGDSRFRLPTLAEATDYPIQEPPLGCWCLGADAIALSGIDSSQFKIWQQTLADLIAADFNRVLDLLRDRDTDLADAIATSPEFKSAQSLIRNQVLDSDLAIASQLTVELAYTAMRNIALDLALTCDMAQTSKLMRSPLGDVVQRLARDVSRDLTHPNSPTVQKASLSSLRANLLLFFIMWTILAEEYEKAAKNRRTQQTIEQTRKSCEDLNRMCLTKRDQVIKLHLFLALMDERQTGKLPAWESIRIVREKVSR
ncbi:MAG TPA: NACHT domain-containing protein, partial [Crinalium sp.]